MGLPTIANVRSPRNFLRRLRFLSAGTCCAFVFAWIISFLPFDDLLDQQGTPLGGDYAMFYLGGQIVAEGNVTQLYDLAEHQQRLRRLFPTLGSADVLPYRYPPFVAAICSPLARLPFAFSWLIFTALSIAAGLLGWRSLRDIDPQRGELAQGVWYAILCWPVTLEVILGGQASLFAFGIAASSLWLMSRQRFTMAGVVLGLACYKPNVLALFVIGCVIRHPRVLRGLIPVVLALAGISWLAVGWEGCAAYATLGQSLLERHWDVPTPYWKVHGLAAWIDVVVAGQGKLLSFGLGLLFVAAWQWRAFSRPTLAGSHAWQRDFAWLLCVNSLCNPYPPIYDLVLLAIPCYFITLAWERTASGAEAAKDRKTMFSSEMLLSLVAAILFFGPHVSQYLSFPLHLQLFTLPLLATVWFLWRDSFGDAPRVASASAPACCESNVET